MKQRKVDFTETIVEQLIDSSTDPAYKSENLEKVYDNITCHFASVIRKTSVSDEVCDLFIDFISHKIVTEGEISAKTLQVIIGVAVTIALSPLSSQNKPPAEKVLDGSKVLLNFYERFPDYKPEPE